MKHRFDFGTVEISMRVENGIIADISIIGDFFGMRDIGELSARLCGVPFTREAILDALCDVRVDEYVSGATPEDIASLLCKCNTVL